MRILISIATKRNLHAELVKWLLTSYSDDSPHGVDIVNVPEPLSHARNLQVKRFLESDYDVLFIVDSDCVPPRTALKLIEDLNLPILSIPHPAVKLGADGQEERALMMLDKVPGGYRSHFPVEGLQEVDAVGCSGLAIKREVFHRLKEPYFRFLFDDHGFLIQGEDFDFCDRAKKAGFKIYVWCEDVQRHYVETCL